MRISQKAQATNYSHPCALCAEPCPLDRLACLKCREAIRKGVQRPARDGHTDEGIDIEFRAILKLFLHESGHGLQALCFASRIGFYTARRTLNGGPIPAALMDRLADGLAYLASVGDAR